MYFANLGDFFALCVYLQWYYVFIQDVFSHINFTGVYSPQYCIIYHLGTTKWTRDVVSTFNVEGWLKSGCNVDQTLLNLKSTLNQLRWKNVLLNETEHIFSNLNAWKQTWLPFGGMYTWFLCVSFSTELCKILWNGSFDSLTRTLSTIPS